MPSQGTTLTADHLPGSDNQTQTGNSDVALGVTRSSTHWCFEESSIRWAPGGGFTSCLTALHPSFYSWYLDQEAEAIDVFTQNWALNRSYANSLWCLISRCLSQVKQHSNRQNGVVNSMVDLASSRSGDAGGLSMSPPWHSRPSDFCSRETVHNGPRSSAVDHKSRLHRSFSSQGLSTNALELMLWSRWLMINQS